MGKCHYCFDCGQCRGETPKSFVFPICLACGFENERGVEECTRCGASLVLQPGVTNTIGMDIAKHLPLGSGSKEVAREKR